MYIKFIKKIALLSILVLSILILFIIFYKHQINNLKIDKNVEIIICGDSHTQSGINDSILKHSINISNSSEPYLSTFNSIRVITKNNPQITTVILGYSFHNLSEFYDDVIFKKKWNKDYYSTYIPILDSESILLLLSHNVTGIIKSVPNILQKMAATFFSKQSNINSYPFLGHFYKSHKSNCNDITITDAVNRHYFNQTCEKNFSAIQEQYLRKIIQFCHKKNINVILLNTPISKGYYDRIPNKFIKKFYLISSELRPHATLFDYHDLKIGKECYGDGDHLNTFGARILTLKLDSLIFVHKT